MLLSTPNGLQYSAKRNTIADTEIMILIKFVESEKWKVESEKWNLSLAPRAGIGRHNGYPQRCGILLRPGFGHEIFVGTGQSGQVVHHWDWPFCGLRRQVDYVDLLIYFVVSAIYPK